MAHDVSIILSTYSSNRFIENYYNNITELIKVANIQLIHVANDPTVKELYFKNKFLKLQQDESIENFQYKFLIVSRESLYTSWNRALKLADSKIIAISNVDDIRYTAGFRIQISEFKKADKMFLVGGQLNLRTRNDLIIHKTKSQKIKKYDLLAGMYVGPFFMWTNPMYFGEDHIYFDEQLYVAGDFDFQIRFATIGKIKILDEILGEYFSDDSGLSTGSILQSIEGQLIYQRYNVIDKKIFFFPFLFFKDRYYPHFFKIDHTPHSLEEVCVKINFIRKKNGKRKKRFISYILDFKTLIKMIIKKNILHRK
jgi:hypothetical protein